MDFKNYLLSELGSSNVIVQDEQLFGKDGTLESNKIYVVVKYLTSSIEYNVKTQPIQMLILSEQNSMQDAKDLFDNFVQTHNWLATTYDDVFLKQQYSTPVVLSNFNEAAYGNRSILYVTGTLYIMENIVDVEDLEIDGLAIEPINFTWSYQMTGNTQQLSSDQIASTVKSVSTFQATLSIPVLSTYGDLLTDLFEISSGASTGNKDFTLTFSVYNIDFSFDCKLVSCQMTTAPNTAPALQVGLQR